MTNDTQDQGQDVFDDSEAGASGADEASITTKEGTGAELEEEGTDDQGDDGQSGEDETGTPPADQDDEGIVLDAKGQKMIPEHRFKAALKKVTDELDETKGKLKNYETPPVEAPDKDVDPEGHDLHIRMEASKSVMMEMKLDYQEVIDHYAEMAKDNDLLNQAVAKHPLPAKLAYDIAKRDLEIKEAMALRDSDDWKEYQEWKKNKGKEPPKTQEQTTLNDKLQRGLGLKTVPNLNRSTNASPNRNVRKNSNGDNDDDLFAGAL